jgi:fluoride ion exporter CrcB/FEX
VADEKGSLLIRGIQLGFIGCLSTVSTFVAEVYTMCIGHMKPKAYVYAFTTLILGLVLSIILYAIPSWTKGYVTW